MPKYGAIRDANSDIEFHLDARYRIILFQEVGGERRAADDVARGVKQDRVRDVLYALLDKSIPDVSGKHRAVLFDHEDIEIVPLAARRSRSDTSARW